MRFPQTFIDDLRRQADIVRVVSDYVSLKKKGTNWMACCPFHQEKSPSFSVNPAKDIFYCFGCQKGGNVFSFVMEMERVAFPEAIRIVAGKAGVALPAMEDDGKFEARRRDLDDVVQLNAWALEWWEQQLEEGGGEAQTAREYVEGRGISEETRKAFRLGFAPQSWDGLIAHLKTRGATAAQIERSGLVVKKDAGGFYDRFRARVIFPVMDSQGRPVAFGARAIRPGDEPKYLNSPETPAYTKGRHLYGLNWSRDEIRRKKFAILVEGYLDLIVPFQAGVRNVVASLGTALTPEQVKQLGRFAKRVVINYDGDRAGIKAAKRATEVFLADDFDVKVLVLPEGSDPDEFVRSEGVEEYQRRRGESQPHIQFFIDQALRDHNLLVPAEKAAAVEEVLPFVRAVRNPIQKREYFDMVTNALRVEDPQLKRELWRSVNPRRQAGASDFGGGGNRHGGTQEREDAQVSDMRERVARAETVPPTMAERNLLELLVHDADLRREFLPHVEEADFEDLPTAGLFRALKEFEAAGAGLTFEALSERTADDPAADLVPQLWMGESQRAEGEATDAAFAEAESCLVTMRLMKAERRMRQLSVEIASAERAGDTHRRDELILESLEWSRAKNALMAHRAAAGVGGGPA